MRAHHGCANRRRSDSAGPYPGLDRLGPAGPPGSTVGPPCAQGGPRMSTSSASRADHRAELLQRRLRGLATSEGGDGIRPRSREGAVALSYAQRRLWILDRMWPGSTEYLMPVLLRLPGALDEDALRRALDEVVARHEVLRTRYTGDDAEPAQLIDPPGPMDLTRADLRPAGRQGAEDELRRLVAEAGARPFDLTAQHPVRALLVRLADDDHALLLTLHHIASDGWSESVLLSELDRLYAAFAAGLPSPLAPPRVQYADFAAWQRERLSGRRLTEQIAYWRRQLAGLDHLALPTDRPRGPVRDPRGAGEDFTVPPAAGRGADRAGPPARRDPVHGLPGRLPGAAGPLRRPERRGGRQPGRGPGPRRHPGHGRAVREHGRDARRPVRPAVLHRAAGPGAGHRAGRVRAPGDAVRAAGRRTGPRTRPLAQPAGPGGLPTGRRRAHRDVRTAGAAGAGRLERGQVRPPTVAVRAPRRLAVRRRWTTPPRCSTRRPCAGWPATTCGCWRASSPTRTARSARWTC